MARGAALTFVLATLVVAGCNNTSAVLDPAALQPGAEPPPMAPPPPSQAPATQQPPTTPPNTNSPAQLTAPSAPAPEQSAAALSAARVYFAPAVGATETAAAPLARRLAVRAAEKGMTVSASEGGSTTHALKGYFSAFSDGPQTTVIYVWDVLDPAGNRLHRIQGQQRVATGQGEGWAAVSPQTMEAIADKTVDDLAAWLGRRPG